MGARPGLHGASDETAAGTLDNFTNSCSLEVVSFCSLQSAVVYELFGGVAGAGEQGRKNSTHSLTHSIKLRSRPQAFRVADCRVTRKRGLEQADECRVEEIKVQTSSSTRVMVEQLSSILSTGAPSLLSFEISLSHILSFPRNGEKFVQSGRV
jgi:hypothetical protein